MNRVGYKQDPKIKPDFAWCMLPGLKPILSRQLIFQTLWVGATFPTFAIEAAAKAAGRPAGPRAAASANRTGLAGMSSLHLTYGYILFCCCHYEQGHIQLEPITLYSQDERNYTRCLNKGNYTKVGKNQVVP